MARATNDVRELNLMLNPGINLVVGSADFLIVPLLVAPTIHGRCSPRRCSSASATAWRCGSYLRELAPITDAVRQHFGVLNAGLAEALDGIEIVKGAAQEPQEIERFERNAHAYRDAFVQQGDIEARFLPLLCSGLTETAGFLHALLLYRAGADQHRATWSRLWLLLQFFGFPTFISLFAYSQVSLGLASAERILELITTETELDENRAGYAAPHAGRDRVRSGVVWLCRRRRAGVPVLHDISFTVEPGQTVAIVGQTGAGKTTPAPSWSTAPTMPPPATCCVDGVDVRDWNLESLRQQISIIEQDIFLFSRTIAENIAFGKPGRHAGGDRSRRPETAQAHDFILELQGRLPDRGRRARRDALGRPAPAPGPGPRLPDQPAHPDPGRLDQRH